MSKIDIKRRRMCVMAGKKKEGGGSYIGVVFFEGQWKGKIGGSAEEVLAWLDQYPEEADTSLWGCCKPSRTVRGALGSVAHLDAEACRRKLRGLEAIRLDMDPDGIE